MDVGGKKLEYFMHNKYMPFLINSLVSIKETQHGWFSQMKDYRSLFFSSHIGLSTHYTFFKSEIITLIFEIVEHQCKIRQAILLFQRVPAQQSALT